MTDDFLTHSREILALANAGTLIDARSYQAALSGLIKQYEAMRATARKEGEKIACVEIMDYLEPMLPVTAQNAGEWTNCIHAALVHIRVTLENGDQATRARMAAERVSLNGQVAMLREALEVLLHATMYKDHPAESDLAIAALASTSKEPT